MWYGDVSKTMNLSGKASAKPINIWGGSEMCAYCQDAWTENMTAFCMVSSRHLKILWFRTSRRNYRLTQWKLHRHRHTQLNCYNIWKFSNNNPTSRWKHCNDGTKGTIKKESHYATTVICPTKFVHRSNTNENFSRMIGVKVVLKYIRVHKWVHFDSLMFC